MAEWFGSLASNHLHLTAVGSSPGTLDFFHVRKLSSQLRERRRFYVDSMIYIIHIFYMILCPLFMPEIMHGGTQEVSSSTSKSWKVPYYFYSVVVT